MPATDARPGRVSQTTPEAIHLVDRLQGTGLPSGTPRFGWIREPNSTVVTHTYRFVVEDSLPEANDAEGVEWVAGPAVDDARVRMLADDPWATDTAGVGYRSYQQSASLYLAWPRRCQDLDTWTGGLWPYYDHIGAASKLASSCAMDLAASVQHESADLLLSRVVEALTSLHANLKTQILALKCGTSERPPATIQPGAEIAIPPVVIPWDQETHVGAIRWLEEHADLSQGAIAELVGVSRQTVRNWLSGETIRDENRQRLLIVRDILERIQRRHNGSVALKTWLDTPRGPAARTPRQLLMANEIGKVRALSLSTAPPRSRSAPAWLLEAPPDPWTDRQRRRRERMVRDEPSEDPPASLDIDGPDRE